MSALGQNQTSAHVRVMSALPPKADITGRDCHVGFVPKADIGRLKVASSVKQWFEPRFLAIGPKIINPSPVTFRFGALKNFSRIDNMPPILSSGSLTQNKE